MKDKKVVVTVSREYGSGGREIGAKIAKELQLPFYDKELISQAAKESGIDEKILTDADENKSNGFWYTLAMSAYSFEDSVNSLTELPVSDQLFLTQSQVIEEIAAKGSCVIVGRCSDYVLNDNDDIDYLINVFIYANEKARVQRIALTENVSEEKAKKMIHKIDKRRASYYNYYTNQKWGEKQNFDLCIDSSRLSTDEVKDVIITYINKLVK